MQNLVAVGQMVRAYEESSLVFPIFGATLPVGSEGVVDPVKVFPHLVWLPSNIWLLCVTKKL